MISDLMGLYMRGFVNWKSTGMRRKELLDLVLMVLLMDGSRNLALTDQVMAILMLGFTHLNNNMGLMDGLQNLSK